MPYRVFPLALPLALFAAALSISACVSSSRVLDENRDHLHRARTIAAAFHHAYGAELGLRDVPFVTIGNDGGSGFSYDADHNVLLVTPYSHADFDTQRIFAKASPEGRRNGTYDALLFEFFTAHQLLHLYYDRLAATRATEYERELRINTLTWLFLADVGLLPATEAEQLALLAEVEDQLADYFPRVAEGRVTPAGIPVDDNVSYWYVTSVSVRESRDLARRVGTWDRFVASVEGNGAVPAERVRREGAEAKRE